MARGAGVHCPLSTHCGHTSRIANPTHRHAQPAGNGVRLPRLLLNNSDGRGHSEIPTIGNFSQYPPRRASGRIVFSQAIARFDALAQFLLPEPGRREIGMGSAFSGRHWTSNRRAVLGAVPGIAAVWAARALGQAPAAQRGSEREPTGVYLAEDRGLGITPFVNDAGERVFLFTDYRSGKVRTLFEQSRGTFTFGPGFADRSSVEGTLRLDQTEGLELSERGGASVRALRIRTRDEEVSFEQGDAALSGTLILPPGQGPHPAIVLLHGSGPLTRYSFGPYPRFFSNLGLAVLFYDKRGTGASTGTRLDASTGRPEALSESVYPDDLRNDALAAVRFLRDRPEIDPDRIGLWGSSEGGMLTTQVAAHDRRVAFVINSVGFMGRLADTILYQGAAKMRAAGKAEVEIAEAVAFNQRWMDVGRSGTGFEAFVAERERVVAGGKRDWLFYEEAGFTSQEQLSWAMKHILDFDSLPDVSRVACPALGLFGERDVLTDAPRAAAAMLQALQRGGNSDASVRVIPNATHSLMEASPRGYMAAGVFDTLQAWIRPRAFRSTRA